MSPTEAVERIAELIKKGREILATVKYPGPGVLLPPYVDSAQHTGWRSQVLHFLQGIIPPDNHYYSSFLSRTSRNSKENMETGIQLLESIKEDLENSRIYIQQATVLETSPIEQVRNICNKFHLISRQLRVRHSGRNTLEIEDEYDVQDLLHALLHQYFDDIRAEEVSPSYAGKGTRMDFLLKKEEIVVEVKKTRPGLADKEIGGQLIEDIARYRSHPNCKALICFVYDPEGRIGNPRGIEADLGRTDSDFWVEVVIRP